MAKYLRFPDEEEYLAYLKNPAKWEELWEERQAVRPLGIGSISYDPRDKYVPQKEAEPEIHPKYGLLVAEYHYDDPWFKRFVWRGYVLELWEGWIKVYHEAWKGGE
jgi:hypothetical protein